MELNLKQKYDRIKYLNMLIDKRIATYKDLEEYEQLLFETKKYKQTIVDDTVKEFGFDNKLQLYKQTDGFQNVKKKEESRALGAIIGIGLGALLLYAVFNDSKK